VLVTVTVVTAKLSRMRRPKASKRIESPEELTQSTLVGFLGSSPYPDKATSPSPKVKRKRAVRPSFIDEHDSDDSGIGAIRFEPKVAVVRDEERDESPPVSRMQKCRRRLLRTSSGGEDPGSGEQTDDAPVRWNGKRKDKMLQVFDTDSEEDCRPRKRKLVKGERPPSPDDELDLEYGIDEAGERRW
jgi:hypothetical protein